MPKTAKINLLWRKRHLHGYLMLEMWELAEAELARIPEPSEPDAELDQLRCTLLHHQARWIELEALTADWAQREPERVQWWITWAIATRQIDGVVQAEAILRDARTRHPKEPAIIYNLGCYACLLGRLGEAETLVHTAFSMEDHLASYAQTDPDLDALRETGRLKIITKPFGLPSS